MTNPIHNSYKSFPFFPLFHLIDHHLRLARGKLASIDDVIGLLHMGLLAVLVERGAGKGHETSTGGLKNAEGGNEFEEGVDSDGFRGAVEKVLVKPRTYQTMKI